MSGCRTWGKDGESGNLKHDSKVLVPTTTNGLQRRCSETHPKFYYIGNIQKESVDDRFYHSWNLTEHERCEIEKNAAEKHFLKGKTKESKGDWKVHYQRECRRKYEHIPEIKRKNLKKHSADSNIKDRRTKAKRNH